MGDMKRCGNCGVECPLQAKFCVECGQKFPEEKKRPENCTECGEPLSPTVKFCPECGAKVEEVPVVEPITAPPTPSARPKKKLSKRGIIALVSVVAVLMIVIVAVVLIVIQKSRLYSVDEVVTAFEDAGYAMSYYEEVEEQLPSAQSPWVDNFAAYGGKRVSGELTDSMYFLYYDCNSVETAKSLYDTWTNNLGDYPCDEVVYGENYCRSAHYDEENGKIYYTSRHEDVVIRATVDYHNYALEGKDYDDVVEDVLNKVNF